jgi:hypothetical protein
MKKRGKKPREKIDSKLTGVTHLVGKFEVQYLPLKIQQPVPFTNVGCNPGVEHVSAFKTSASESQISPKLSWQLRKEVSA